MNIGYVFLIIMASAACFVSGVPTPDQMIADFNSAQKFYTSSAYDQAIELYDKVGKSESIFVDEEKVIVTIGSMKLQVKDATLYQIGNSYNKMTIAALDLKENATKQEEKNIQEKLALEYINKAVDYYDKTQELSKDQELKILAQNQIVETWYLIKDHKKVIEEGNQLIEKYPSSIYVRNALYNIGWAYYDQKEYVSSIKYFEDLIKRFPTDKKAERSLYQIGEAYFDQGDYNKAIPYYQQLVDKMRINELTQIEILKIQREKISGVTDDTSLDLAARAALRIGACYGNLGDFEKAEQAYKRMAKTFTYDKSLIQGAYTNLASMYYDKGDFASSIKTYRDAIDEVNDRITAAKMQVLIAQNYFKGDKKETKYYQNAITEYQRYIDNYSDVAARAGFDVDQAFFWLARSYAERGIELKRAGETNTARENIQQSINKYLQLLKEFPGTKLVEMANFYVGISYQEFGDDEHTRQALTTFNTILTTNPETPYKEYIIVFIARSHKSLKEYDKSLEYYNRMVTEYPTSKQIDGVWYEMAAMMRDKGDENASIPYLAKVSTENKSLFTTAVLLSAQTLLKSEKYQEAIVALDKGIENKNSIENENKLSLIYLLRGNAYKGLNNNNSALENYTQAYNLNDPETKQTASVYRAGVYIDLNQLERAETDLKELIKSNDEAIRRAAQMRLAIISVNQGKSEQAIQTYLDIYNSTNDENEKLGFLRNLIQLSSTSKRWDDLNKFTNMMLTSSTAEGKKPDNANFFYKEEAYFFLGNAAETRATDYEKQNRSNEAINEERKAIEIYLDGYKAFPNSFYSSDMLLKVAIKFLTKLANLPSEPDALDYAAEYFQSYITKFPDTPNTEMAHYYLGFCYYNSRRFNESAQTFADFERKYPDSEFTAEAIFYNADCNYNLGNLERSVEGFSRLLSRYPRHEKVAEALYTQAWAYLDLLREEEAMKTMQKLVDQFPQNELAATALFSIADYYYNAQKYEEALTNYEEVLARFPKSDVAKKVPETMKELKETVAYIEYEKGLTIFTKANEISDMNLHVQAIEIFKKVVADYPGTESEIGAYSNMGISLEALGRWQEAVDAYNKVIQKYDDGAGVSEEAFKFARMHKDYIVANRL